MIKYHLKISYLKITILKRYLNIGKFFTDIIYFHFQVSCYIISYIILISYIIFKKYYTLYIVNFN